MLATVGIEIKRKIPNYVLKVIPDTSARNFFHVLHSSRHMPKIGAP